MIQDENALRVHFFSSFSSPDFPSFLFLSIDLGRRRPAFPMDHRLPEGASYGRHVPQDIIGPRSGEHKAGATVAVAALCPIR